jgi:cytidylate kinase
MIVTIDGPSGAGKSTTSREVARRLGFRFLDTGAMYRAVALAAQRSGHDWNQPDALVKLTAQLQIELNDGQVFLNGDEVSGVIRSMEITSLTHYAADNPGVRSLLVEWQRQAAGSDNVVAEGRDQGTVAFPHAECKIFLTASPEERARRRVRDLAEKGEHVSFEEVLAQQLERDEKDANRAVGPLVKAKDAIEFHTDGLTEEDVVAQLVRIVESKVSPANART